MNSPLVSILMPVFNEEKYISEAIESVLHQTYSNFELIIVNDGSTDKTSTIIKQYSDQRIHFYNPGKVGKVAAYNFALSKSIGEYICIFAGDDVLPKDSIGNRIKPIKDISKDPAISFCKMQTLSRIKKFNGVVIPKGNKGNLSGGAMMFNRAFSNRSFPIPEQLVNEDMWQVQHALYFRDIAIRHIPLIGIYFRIHSGNSSSKQDNFAKKTESMHKRFIVYKLFLDRYQNSLDSKGRLRLRALSKAENLRYNNKWIKILLLNNLSFVQKMRFVMYSHSFFYNLRMRFFSLFSGRGK